MKYVLKLTILAFLTMFSLVAYAQEGTIEQPDSYVKIRVLTEYGAVEPGQSIWIGVEQSIYPHWHTYWDNPGDSGAATQISWDLPEGFSVSDIYWPTPQKIPYGDLMNYGYENNAILLQKLTAPDVLPDGDLTFTAQIDVLVCKDICIPESSTHTVALNTDKTKDEDNAVYLDAARMKLPQKVDWDAAFVNLGQDLKVTLAPTNVRIFDDLVPGMVEVFPLEWGMVDNFAKPEVVLQDDRIVVTQARGERKISDIKDAGFVIAIGKGAGRLAYQVKAAQEASPTPMLAEQAPIQIVEQTNEFKSSGDGMSILWALFLALLGGMILNLMPCVFPVLSLKALSLVKIADEHPEQARMHGVSYTAGVVLSFVAIAGVLIVLKATGAEIGWGFQLQNSLVVGLLAYLLFIIGLNLFGFFEFSSSFANIGGLFAQGHGYASSFMTGVLATIVATPCTAPFMAAAIGFALTQSALTALLIFAALGLGLALPYLVLAFLPQLEKMLPKPGAWMEHFKQFLAFPMFISAAWLVWVLSQQSGAIAVLYVLGGAIAIVFAFWASKISNHKLWVVMPVLMALGLLVFLPPSVSDMKETVPITGAFSQNWTPSSLETALSSNDPVFVEMTAAWCITCKLNNKTSLDIDATRVLFAAEKVQYLIGDWTNQNGDITKYLNSYGRNGVPLYIFYGRPDEDGKRPEPKVLPQILTPHIVKDAVVSETK